MFPKLDMYSLTCHTLLLNIPRPKSSSRRACWRPVVPAGNCADIGVGGTGGTGGRGGGSLGLGLGLDLGLGGGGAGGGNGGSNGGCNGSGSCSGELVIPKPSRPC